MNPPDLTVTMQYSERQARANIVRKDSMAGIILGFRQSNHNAYFCAQHP